MPALIMLYPKQPIHNLDVSRVRHLRCARVKGVLKKVKRSYIIGHEMKRKRCSYEEVVMA